jgi:hypothetical protein
MRKKIIARDPIADFQREETAARRVGKGQKCKCGESRPQALLVKSKHVICAECKRKKSGQSTFDEHHFAGKANDSITVPIPVNDHRSVLSVVQHDWPRETLENRGGSPLLASAAKIRGSADMILYLVEKTIRVAEMNEILHSFLEKKLGPKWWVKTEIEQFEPDR